MCMKDNVACFLEQYKILEELLEEKYRGTHLRTNSVVREFIADVDATPYKEKLDLCRQVRNLLVHSAELDGEAPLMPSDALIKTLEEIIAFVRKPPMVLEFATLRSELMTADLKMPVLPLIRKMKERGYSHVPVLRDGCVYGVFSWNILINYMMHESNYQLDPELLVRDLRQYLPLKEHDMERYLFRERNSTYFDIKQAFENNRIRNRRLACIFITENGTQNEPLLGLVTPWDLLKESVEEYG